MTANQKYEYFGLKDFHGDCVGDRIASNRTPQERFHTNDNWSPVVILWNPVNEELFEPFFFILFQAVLGPAVFVKLQGKRLMYIPSKANMTRVRKII